MKIYTKTGDAGETGLFGGARVRKDTLRVHTYGEIDELNSVIGLCRAAALPEPIDAALAIIQSELFDLGAELCATPERLAKGDLPCIDEGCVTRLEHAIDNSEGPLPALKTFVLPGGSEGAARLHLARTTCRRAERSLVTLMNTEGEAVRPVLLHYLNRLSDLLFTYARRTNHELGVADVPWESGLRGAPSGG